MPRFILVETRALIIWALRCFMARLSWHNWPRRFLRKLEEQVPKINLNFVDDRRRLCHKRGRVARAIDSLCDPHRGESQRQKVKTRPERLRSCDKAWK